MTNFAFQHTIDGSIDTKLDLQISAQIREILNTKDPKNAHDLRDLWRLEHCPEVSDELLTAIVTADRKARQFWKQKHKKGATIKDFFIP